MSDSESDSNSESNGSVLVELLERARNGDDGARDELFDRCRNYVSLLARVHIESWLQARVDPSDLVQQTLLEAYRGMGGFKGQSEGEWLAWLKQILKNNATDYIRRYKGTAKRRIQREVSIESPRHGSSQFRMDLSDPGDSPSQLVMQYENEIQLAEAVSRLDEDYQEVILLRNVQRLSFNEVAQRMDRSRPAAQMLWLRALRKLKANLQDVEGA
jgi:RNA polymerase sigma-70 factor (ECF subfamily)